MEYIKANLPATEEEYQAGNGEGVFVLVDERTKKAHDTNATGGSYEGVLDNDSFTYKGLEHGAKIPLEMRGEYRPVIPLKWLEEHYKKAEEE